MKTLMAGRELWVRVHMLGWREARRQRHIMQDGTGPDDPADLLRVVEEPTTRGIQAAPTAF